MLLLPAHDNNITRLTAICRTTQIGGYQKYTTLDVTGAKMMEVMVTTGTKLQSNHHSQQTSIQRFTGEMPFMTPNQQCQSTEWRNYHIPRNWSPEAHLESSIIVLTINSSWLP